MFFRKKRIIIAVLIIISLISALSLIPKEEIAYENISSSIDENNIKKVVEELTSEKYNGRLIGTEGNRLATDYIVDEFKRMGLRNPDGLKGYEQSYRQNVRVTNSTPVLYLCDEDNKVKKHYKYIEDFSVVTHNSMLSIKGEAKGVGRVLYSVDKLRQDKSEFKDKIILIPKELLKSDGFRNIISHIVENKIEIEGIVVELDVQKKVMSTFPVAPNVNSVNSFKEVNPISFTVESETFENLVKSSQENSIIHMSTDYSIENVKGSNVIGVIEGTDEDAKDEHIIIGAHFDHVGDNKDGTYNPGALDNASGVASLIEIAKTIMENKIPPKKTIVFIAFNGEEEGLYGSYHYADNPIYPLNDKTVMINLDMVGSKRKVPLAVVSYDSKNIKLRNEFLKLGKALDIDVKAGVNQGSDHVAFAAKGIKSVCLINMDLESGYHTPLDTSKKVDKKRSKEICNLVLYYLDEKVY